MDHRGLIADIPRMAQRSPERGRAEWTKGSSGRDEGATFIGRTGVDRVRPKACRDG
jgi:hypothetical protein